ncbi:TonB-dependent receptor plug domain protein [gut metagenome]|uniref:TonB-dependent receptor plug domain protein n=1 Tax=gut metagenome TaxID=749906 RepID=J9FXT5_9ZZZZ
MAFLLMAIGHLSAQITKMTGIVLSAEDDTPIVGASILVEGTTRGTISNTEGKFQIDQLKPGDKRIIVSFIGMKTQAVNIKSHVQIKLATESELMDEVMVVAYGTAKRSAFTGSASVVNAEKLTKRQTTNVVQALAGQVAGLQMTSGSGQAGGSSPTLLIRGIGSINAGTAPLIIVDGMPYEGGWNNINPADVESVSVLKDAASNALYGARGANGVIIITTKQAKTGDAVITASAKWGVNTRGNIDYDYIDDPGQYYEVHYNALYNQLRHVKGLSHEEAHIKANQNMVGSTKELGGLGYNVYSYPENEYLIGSDGKLNPNARLGRVVNGYMLLPDDWVDEAFSSALRQEYNINLTGGSNKMQMFGSFGYLNDEGIVPNNSFERFSARFKGSYQAKKWLKFGANVSYTHTIASALSESYDTDMSSFTEVMAPIYPVYVRDAHGNILTDLNGKMYDYGNVTGQPGLARPNHPNSAIQESIVNQQQEKGNTFNVNGFTDINFLKDFKFSFNIGTTVNENRYYTTDNPWYGFGAEQNGTVSVYHYRTTTLNLQQILNYSHSFGLHNVSVMAGHESYKYNYVELAASKKNMFSYWDNQELNGAIVDNASASSYASDYNTEGYFFRALYDYNNKYYFSTSFRRDASSRFHPDHRWGNFYSFGAAWLLSKEEWFQAPWVDMLKLKFSIGQQGNDNIGNYYYTDRFSIKNSNDNLSVSFNGKGKKNITWETNTNVNLGVEFDLFKGKLNGGLEVFYRKTSDMLNWFTVPLSLGYAGYYDNVGDMENKGVELELNYIPFQRKNFTWRINLNLTHYKNEISYLPEEKKTVDMEGHAGYMDGSRYYGEGLPINTWYMKRFAGINEEGLSTWYYTDKETNEEKTTTTYASGDYYLCGDPNPDLYGGFGTSLSFYGFDFSAQFSYSVGGEAYDGGYASLMSNPTASSVGYRLHKDVLQAWTPENPNPTIPRWYFDDRNTASSSDRFLIDGSYLNFQNIQLGYTLPAKWTRPLSVSNLRLYVTCDNVYYWSKRKGFDPRRSISGNGAQGKIAPFRTFSGGISLQF